MHPFKTSFFVLLSTLSIFPAWADDNMIEIQKQGNISFVTGGVGQEESDALAAMRNNYNLRITNTDMTGHFLSDTHIVVRDPNHRAVLDTSGGPFFYASLPNGHYMVEGSSEGRSKKQAVTIAGGKPVRVHFAW